MSRATTLPSSDDSPELAYLRRTYEREFQEAFQTALASLSSRERNILRYHFVDGLSIDRIGDFYGVHRATAARWLNRAREALCLMTREILGQRISLSQDGFRRMLSLIESQISVRMALMQA
jgi:RNA polymerase sigma-70 factor (ECF subfamily)